MKTMTKRKGKARMLPLYVIIDTRSGNYLCDSTGCLYGFPICADAERVLGRRPVAHELILRRIHLPAPAGKGGGT